MKRYASLKTAWIAVFILSPLTRLAVALDDPIQLNSGKIAGTALDHKVRIYKGIPFAAPPVGELRWKPPQPVAPWEGVRSCYKFGPIAIQGGGGGARGNGAAQNMSEDCLYLNVWTPAKTAGENLPVMVWIHGGGWTSGSGSAANYSCEAFARKGVVAVTVNYRMGTLGFLAHPLLSKESPKGVSGNYGLLDHIAALEWVRDNIAAFGGNPSNVTIFGESAGGASVYVLVASPLAKGLFHKAIAESAWVTETNMRRLKEKTGFGDSAEAIGEEATKGVVEGKQGDPLAILRALPAEEANRLRGGVAAVADGWFLPRLPAEIYARGEQNPVPVLAGTNNGEGIMFAGRGARYETVEAYREARVKEFGDSADELLQHYGAKSVEDIQKANVDFISDAMFIRATREMVRAVAKSPQRAFMYHFTRNARNPEQGASHAAELPYVFMKLGDDRGEADRKLSDTMNSYWVQFAKTGDPNGSGLPAWPAFTAQSEQYEELTDPIKSGSFLRKDALDALDRRIEKRNREAAAAR